MLEAKIKLSPVALAAVFALSIDNPFSQPTTSEFKHEVEVFLLNLNAFSNFSPTGNTIVPFPFGPTIVMLEKIGRVLGCAVDPVASLSDSKQFESPGASDKSLSRMASPNCIFPLYPKSVSKSSSKPL